MPSWVLVTWQPRPSIFAIRAHVHAPHSIVFRSIARWAHHIVRYIRLVSSFPLHLENLFHLSLFVFVTKPPLCFSLMDPKVGIAVVFMCIVVAGVGGQSPASAPSAAPTTGTPPAASPSKPESPAPALAPRIAVSAPQANAPAAAPVSPPAQTPLSSPASAPVSSPPAATPVQSPAPELATPPAKVPVAAPTQAPTPALLSPPAPPSQAPGPNPDSISPSPSGLNDQSGAMKVTSMVGSLVIGWAVLSCLQF